jgi:hypothetical protein
MSTPRGRVAICYSLGTLRDRLLVDRVLGELGADGIEAKVRTEERRGDLSGYWVLLPARPSLEAAQAQIDELQQRGIDSFVVGTGEYRNAVSLGFFHGRRAAEELEARIRAQGYNPRLVLRYQQESQYWLDLDETASERFGDWISTRPPPSASATTPGRVSARATRCSAATCATADDGPGAEGC